jgi:predicted phosphodiesterase
MMKLAFDLISDLHLDFYTEPFDWQGQATAPYCILAGDVARDRQRLISTLHHLGQCYQTVFYVDGNDEHKLHMDDVAASYKDLHRRIAGIPNVVYLHNSLVVLNDIAIVATNGWWNFEFDPEQDINRAVSSWLDHTTTTTPNPIEIVGMSINDSQYLINAVQKLQRHIDVKKIVVVTHTVPDQRLIAHDPDLKNNWRASVLGNDMLHDALAHDTQKKITTWCFGHYHANVDEIIDGVRFVNNCRGRPEDTRLAPAYFAKRIEV